jgi:NAD(P)-dependent dehydrogenase (short-subunit alcohol dehydrogenase family)
VLATARDAASIADLAELGLETLSLVVDDSESVKACFADVKARLGDKGLDYLVNNACVYYYSDLNTWLIMDYQRSKYVNSMEQRVEHRGSDGPILPKLTCHRLYSACHGG